MTRAIVLGALALTSACTSFQPVAEPSRISSRAIQIRFQQPRDLEGRTERGVLTRLPEVRRLRGVVRAVAQDTVVVEARSVDTGNGWLRLSPSVHLPIVAAAPAVCVDDRRFSYINTALGVAVSWPFALAAFYIIVCTLTSCSAAT